MRILFYTLKTYHQFQLIYWPFLSKMLLTLYLDKQTERSADQMTVNNKSIMLYPVTQLYDNLPWLAHQHMPNCSFAGRQNKGVSADLIYVAFVWWLHCSYLYPSIIFLAHLSRGPGGGGCFREIY